MSENLDELLNIPDEENEGDYDLADDEEEALLDESYDLANKSHTSAINDTQNTAELEQDVLDLDDETELNDEDSEILNSTTEEEERCRQDKFSSERVVPQKVSVEPNVINNRKFRGSGKLNFRGGFNRGKRVMNRGHYHNNQHRSMQFQQRSKVLINPHFKGNVPIKHNVSLAWDKNTETIKKPIISVQPWAQQTTVESPILYQQNSAPSEVYLNQQYQPQMQNSRLPVHQRLGISTNSFSSSLSDNRLTYAQNFQQPNYNVQVLPQQQFQQNPMYSQPQFANNFNNMNQFVSPVYNNNNNHGNVNKPLNPQYQQQWPITQSQPVQTVFNPNHNYCNYSVPPPQLPQPQFVQTFSNNPAPNIINYPTNVPVVNNQIKRTDLFYEDREKPFQRVRKFSGGSPNKRRFEFKGELKKKKRTVSSSNLQEVKTIDVQTFEEEEDEEMRAYRKKIAQQKIIREKLLRQKEERRKQAAKKLQAEEEYMSLPTPTDIVKEEIPVIMNTKKIVDPVATPQVVKAIKRTQVVRVNKTIVPIETVDNPFVVKRVVSAKPISCEKNVSADNNDLEALNKDQLSSFLSNRKIFAKDKSLADTSVVVVNNLATGTSEVKLRKLCQGVGDIQVRVVKANDTYL